MTKQGQFLDSMYLGMKITVTAEVHTECKKQNVLVKLADLFL